MKPLILSKTLQHWRNGEVDMNSMPPPRPKLRLISYSVSSGQLQMTEPS